MRFEGKAVVLTGIGRPGQAGESIARAFAGEGASIVAISRTPGEAESRATELREAGYVARGYACDLTDAARVADVARDVAAAHPGGIHALVNAAGGFAMSGPVGESDLTVWQRQLAINLTTAYLATRAFLPLVRAARGAVVYFASAAALPNAKVKGMAAYAVAKSGVVTLMRAVAEEEREHDVRANAVAPTAIRTAANLESMGEQPRYVTREAVADAVLFLCSEQARAITGQTIVVS